MRLRNGQCGDTLLIGISILAAFLNIFGIWWQDANTFYTTAVTSMLQSWHNFFYASLDPAGYITIDKPPVTFWVQTLFAGVLGMHNWSVILPQALAGVGSVLLLYYLVKPTFGKTAARLASLVMACTPIAVAVSRSNNIDSMLVFTLLLATWMLFKAVNTGKPGWAIGGFAIIGVGFNMKMFQAYMVVPAFYLFYLLAFRYEWKRKLAVLAAATAVMVMLTVSWATIVDAIPITNRPYIGGSGTNSVWALALGYNGIQRLDGMGGPGGGAPGGNAQNRQPGQAKQPSKATASANNNYTEKSGSMLAGREMPSPGNETAQGQMPGFNGGGPQGQAPPSGGGQGGGPGGGGPGGGQVGGPGGGPGGGGGGGGGNFHTGNPGPLRLFQSSLSDQISWMLPFVAFACIALLVGRRRKRAGSEPLLQENGKRPKAGWAGFRVLGMLASLLTTERTETLFWLGWLLPGMWFFSVAGFYHQYYLIMLAPPIAALTGAGWALLWSQYRDREGWKMWLLPLALLATLAFQWYILKPYQNQIVRGWAIAILVACTVIVLTLVLVIIIKRAKLSSTRTARALAIAGLLVLLASPTYWSATPLLYGVDSVMPAAGPGNRITFARGSEGGNGSNFKSDDALIEYVTEHNTGEPCLFATTDTGTAESYILSGKSVIALGGFNGGDDTIVKLKQMVQEKKIKFFLISSGGFGGGGGSNDVSNWIKTNCTVVPGKDWQSGSAQGGQTGAGGTLYEVNG
jgi:4-amino-4-deoxy-L-arabinose transferase-like glycosyltransferase